MKGGAISLQIPQKPKHQLGRGAFCKTPKPSNLPTEKSANSIRLPLLRRDLPLIGNVLQAWLVSCEKGEKPLLGFGWVFVSWVIFRVFFAFFGIYSASFDGLRVDFRRFIILLCGCAVTLLVVLRGLSGILSIVLEHHDLNETMIPFFGSLCELLQHLHSPSVGKPIEKEAITPPPPTGFGSKRTPLGTAVVDHFSFCQ